MSARREGRAVGEVGPREIKGAGRNGSWAGLKVGSGKGKRKLNLILPNIKKAKFPLFFTHYFGMASSN
jgi:hypothetical protein